MNYSRAFDYSSFRTYLMDWYMGLYFGYPVCCISNFIRLQWANKRPTAAYMCDMHKSWDDCAGYVRCHSCQKNPLPVRRREEYLDLASKFSGHSKEVLINERLTLNK